MVNSLKGLPLIEFQTVNYKYYYDAYYQTRSYYSDTQLGIVNMCAIKCKNSTAKLEIKLAGLLQSITLAYA